MTTSNNNNTTSTCVGEPLPFHNLSLNCNGSDACEEKELSTPVTCDSGMQSLDESSDSTRESVSEKTEHDDLDDDVFVQVLYNYEYNLDNGEKVIISKGDTYRLLSDNSDDWWQVEKVEDGNIFYVPAEFVFKCEDYYLPNNRPLPPILVEESSHKIQKPVEINPTSSDDNITKPVTVETKSISYDDNIMKPVETKSIPDADISKPIPVETKSIPHSDIMKPVELKATLSVGGKKKKHPAPVPTPEMLAAAKSKSRSNSVVLNRSFSSDNAGIVSMINYSTFGWPDLSEVSPQTSFSVNNNNSSNNNNNNNNNFDACIPVVVNSDNQYPQEILRTGNCSTFGKSQLNYCRTQERPKSYGGFNRYNFERPENIKTVQIGKSQTSRSNSDYINLDELGPVLKYQQEPENGSVESLSSNPKDRKSEALYENVQLIQSVMKYAPKMDNSVFIKKYSEHWDIYEDKSNGQQFYFNKESKKTTWKPPRPEKPPPSIPNINVVDEESSSGEKVKNGPQKIPIGWRKDIDSRGEMVFFHCSSEQKWKQSIDQTGRPYYYREGSTESVWDLPVYFENLSVNNEIPPVNMAKSMTLQHQPPLISVPPQRSKTLPSQMPSYVESPEKVQPSRGTAFDVCQNKTGILNKTKIMDNGKKVGKKWGQTYVKLFGSNIAFYKDQRAAAVGPGAKNGNPEQIVYLHGAKCKNASKDISSKKNVLQLEDVQGNHVLLQSEDPVKIQEWLVTINWIISELASEEESQSPSSSSMQPQHSPEPNQKTPKGTSKEPKQLFGPKAKTRALSTKRQRGKDDDKMTIREKLTNLLTGRPTIESLEAKGIIKADTTFGALLKDVCFRDNSTVPNFVEKCIKSIEYRGLKQDGLYRVSGNLAEIQKLRLSVDKINANSQYNLDDECWDIHTLTGALKLFFRELKEPLVPFNKFDKLMEVVRAESGTNREETLRKYKEIIHGFPKCHLETLKMLLQHLLRVIRYSEHNRMLTQNVAIVFGPTLMWPERELHNLAISITYQSQIVQFLLQNYGSVF